jgi:hypothetical protein
VREHGLGGRDGAEEHHLHQLAQLRRRELLDRADRAVAGVVDQHVDLPERLQRGLDGRVDRRRVGDVERRGAQPVAAALGEVGQRVRLARGRQHPVASGERGQRDLAAEAGGAAGDQPYASWIFHASSLRAEPREPPARIGWAGYSRRL